MADTRIEWADKVWNPVTGCKKVSQGCKNCYAERLHDLRHQAYQEGKKVPAQYAEPFETVQLHPDRLEDPLHWKKPARIFVNSMSDLFHEDVPFKFIDQVFVAMKLAWWHTFMVLTKRPQRMHEYMTKYTNGGWDRWEIIRHDAIEKRGSDSTTASTVWPFRNVWLGVSVEDQKTADERIPVLLQTPAAVRFVSCEPLLGAVDLRWVKGKEGGHYDFINGAAVWGYTPRKNYEDPSGWKIIDNRPPEFGIVDHLKLDWVICGGESGPGARPMHPDWARGLRDQCHAAGVPFFFKQWGEWAHEGQIWKDPMAPMIQLADAINPKAYQIIMNGRQSPEERGWQFEDRSISYRVGKKAAGRALDGKEWDEFPEVRG